MPLISKVDYSKSIPSFWTDEDKIEYDILVQEAKKIFPNTDDFVIHIGVEAWINNMKGTKRGCTDEDIKAVMKKYDNKSLVLETPKDENFNMDDTMLKKTSVIENNLNNIIEDKEENEIL